MKKLLHSNNSSSWEELLTIAILSMNSKPDSMTGVAPCELLLGMETMISGGATHSLPSDIIALRAEEKMSKKEKHRQKIIAGKIKLVSNFSPGEHVFVFNPPTRKILLLVPGQGLIRLLE